MFRPVLALTCNFWNPQISSVVGCQFDDCDIERRRLWSANSISAVLRMSMFLSCVVASKCARNWCEWTLGDFFFGPNQRHTHVSWSNPSLSHAWRACGGLFNHATPWEVQGFEGDCPRHQARSVSETACFGLWHCLKKKCGWSTTF